MLPEEDTVTLYEHDEAVCFIVFAHRLAWVLVRLGTTALHFAKAVSRLMVEYPRATFSGHVEDVGWWTIFHFEIHSPTEVL